MVRVAPHERAAPPDRLGGDESTIWREIVASKPADWFGPDSPHLETAILTSSDYDLAALQAGLSEYFTSSAEGSFNWVDVAR